MKYLLLIIFGFLTSYLMFSFMVYDLNPANFDMSDRGFIIVIGIMFSVLYITIYFGIKNKILKL